MATLPHLNYERLGEYPTLEDRSGRSRALATARSVGFSTVALGTLVFVATWGGGLVAPYSPPAIDSSAHAALNMAAVRGLHYGTDFLYTYGPLGFLKSNFLFYPGTARLAALYGIAVYLALSISLVWALRRNFPAVLALAIALVAAVLARGDQAELAVRPDAQAIVLAFIWCVAALSAGAPEWTRRLVVLAGGPFAAIEVLAKLNSGLVILALFAITVAAIGWRRWRDVGIGAVSFIASIAVLWFATGQGIGNAGPFVSGGIQLISGYASGMPRSAGHLYEYVGGSLLVLAAVAIAWISTRDLDLWPRISILAMVVIVAFSAAKGGFVSADEFHLAIFYATMLGVCVAFPLPPGAASRVGVLAVVAGATALGSTASFPGYPMTNPLENARNGFQTMAALTDTGELEHRIATSRASLVSDYDLDPRTLKLLRGHTVHVDPSEDAAAWAYGLDWKPLPVFQSYLAWTKDLDERNATAVASASGPDRILRQNLNALGRYPGFESPRATVETLCHFRSLRTTARWQVVGRIPDRCGEPEPLGHEDGTYGVPIRVPPAPPHTIVIGRAHGVEVTGLESLRTFLYRSRLRQVSFGRDPARYRFIPATAADGLLLRAPRGIDYPPPFTLAPDANTITFWLDGQAADQSIEVDFYAIPVR